MLNIVIVGAGIAGLSAAVSLRRVGHYVDVYEQSSAGRHADEEAGAAITIPPNASRILAAWGVVPRDWSFVACGSSIVRDASTLEPLAVLLENEGTARAIAGADDAENYSAHRSDLHACLRWLATREDGAVPGRPARIHCSSKVAAYDPSVPCITLLDGRTIRADVVVGADGVHSAATRMILKQRGLEMKAEAPADNANMCYRFVIPVAVLEEDVRTRVWCVENKSRVNIFAHHPTRRRLAAYTCRNRTLFNFAALLYDESVAKAKGSEAQEDWHRRASVDEVLDSFAGFHPDVMSLISKAKQVRRWPLLYRRPLETWHQEMLVVVGDAAHPMLPHLAQGGAQGIEDGLTLGIILHGVTAGSRAEISRRLQIFEDVRKNRASVIQILSNMGQDETGRLTQDMTPYLAEEMIPTTPADIARFNYAHDAVKVACEAMRCQLDKDFSLPEGFLNKK